MVDPHQLLCDVLSDYTDADKWIDSRFENVKRLSNTHVGSVGEDFVERLCKELGFDCEFPLNEKGVRSKNAPWDISIKGVSFEVKTATEDGRGSFQFNHVRYHREYDALLCIGISPDEILFGAWSKADVATGKAGHLVTMDKGSSATHKLTKRRNQLRTIDNFMDDVLGLVSGFSS